MGAGRYLAGAAFAMRLVTGSALRSTTAILPHGRLRDAAAVPHGHYRSVVACQAPVPPRRSGRMVARPDSTPKTQGPESWSATGSSRLAGGGWSDAASADT